MHMLMVIVGGVVLLGAHVFFTESEKSRAKARDFLKRFRLRTEGRDP